MELQALRGPLPPIQAETFNANQTPVDDGSFLISGGEVGSQTRSQAFLALDAYNAMPKGLATYAQADVLQDLHTRMVRDPNPVLQAAAGWAAVESALMSGLPVSDRLSMLDDGINAWERSIITQPHDMSDPSGRQVNATQPLRTEHALLTVPVYETLIQGSVTHGAVEKVFADTLELAQRTRKLRDDADDDSDIARDYAGLNSELLLELARNLPRKLGYMSLPATMRADSGYAHRDMTHDLIDVTFRGSRIIKAIPTEVKGTVTNYHRLRYRALLVGSKQMVVKRDDKQVTNTQKLEAIAAVYQGTATTQQRQLANSLQKAITTQVGLYERSRRIGRLSPRSSVTVFHDQFGREYQI